MLNGHCGAHLFTFFDLRGSALQLFPQSDSIGDMLEVVILQLQPQACEMPHRAEAQPKQTVVRHTECILMYVQTHTHGGLLRREYP